MAMCNRVKCTRKTCSVVYTVNKVACRKHHFTTSCGIIIKQNLQLPVKIIPMHLLPQKQGWSGEEYVQARCEYNYVIQ